MITSDISTPQSMLSSIAFLISPFRRLFKVICRDRDDEMASIAIFRRPIGEKKREKCRKNGLKCSKTAKKGGKWRKNERDWGKNGPKRRVFELEMGKKN
jgi:hypothetical protein